MEYVAVAFRSRAHTVRFSEFLRRNGYGNEIINTPKEAGVGCGLSVKVNKEIFPAVRRAALSSGLNSLAGFFLVTARYGTRSVRPI